MKKYYSIQEIQNDYIYTSQGHWFDKDTMKFFKTKLTGNFKILTESQYAFITTEQGPVGPRMATIRIVDISVDESKHCGYKMSIASFGEFNKLTLAKAKSLMARM